jgi:uncharacterized membrane protein YbhN (UPF0104 family)
MPVFLMGRVLKWYLLVRQVSPDVRLKQMTPGYLRAMAWGLITPGRLGEVSRAWAMGNRRQAIGLFFLEKTIEIGSLVCLCGIALLSFEEVPRWALAAAALIGILALLTWKRSINWLVRAAHRRFGFPNAESCAAFESALTDLRIGGCAVLTAAVQIMIVVQTWLVLASMVDGISLATLRYLPVVFTANWLPISVGGTGVREGIAVLLLRRDGIAEAAAMNSVLVVTMIDLVIVPVLAVIWHAVRPPRLPAMQEARTESAQ